MTQKDQLKVMNQGFKIIRADQHSLLIKYKAKDCLHLKVLYNGFPTKAALQRKMDELLKYDFTIED